MRELEKSRVGLARLVLALGGGAAGAGLCTGLGFCLLGPAGGGAGFLLGSGLGLQAGASLGEATKERKD